MEQNISVSPSKHLVENFFLPLCRSEVVAVKLEHGEPWSKMTDAHVLFGRFRVTVVIDSHNASVAACVATA